MHPNPPLRQVPAHKPMSDKPAFPSGSKLAAYLRDSGHEDQETSIAQQDAEIKYWCIQNGYELTRIYSDAAAPGSSTVGRTQFIKMIDYFRSEFCVEAGIVVWQYSRFSRDINESQFYRSELRKNGFGIYSLNDPIPDGPASIIFEAATDWKNQTYLTNLAKDIKRGQRFILREYGALGGYPPKGFMRVPITIGKRRDGRPHIVNRWVPDPDQIERVREAFRMRAADMSYKAINRELGLFRSTTSYKTFFLNRLFIGELVFGDDLIKNYCEPVIDRETFEAVQIVQEKHAQGLRDKHPRRVSSDYILSGLIYCARCGAPLNGNSVHMKSTPKYRYQYYACSAEQRGACDAKKIVKPVIERLVIEQLAMFILAPENIELRASEYLNKSNELVSQAAIIRNRVNNQLTTTRNQIENITAIMAAEGTKVKSLVNKLRELEIKEHDLIAERAKLFTPQEIEILPPLELEDMRKILLALLDDKKQRQELKKSLEGLIQRVEVERDDEERLIRGQIIYYLPQKEVKKNKITRKNSFMSMREHPPGALLRRC
jgi:site-specific DNA recombinase